MSALAIGGFLQGLNQGYRASHEDGRGQADIQQNRSIWDRLGLGDGTATGIPGAAQPGRMPVMAAPAAPMAQQGGPMVNPVMLARPSVMATGGIPAMAPAAAPMPVAQPSAPAVSDSMFPSIRRALASLKGG